MKSFIRSKLSSKAINSPAINYGKVHEDTAIRCYTEYQKERDIQLIVRKCGLYINPAIPWLAATPDSIVENDQEMGCLEVKCPFVCKTKQIAVAALEQSSFCLQSNNGMLQLKRTHQYFYQVQTQLFVTQLPWCDFVLWSPGDVVYVERIFMTNLLLKMQFLRLEHFILKYFLPSVFPHVIIADNYEVARISEAPTTELVLKVDARICDYAEIYDNCNNVEIVDNPETCDGVEVLNIPTVHRPIAHT